MAAVWATAATAVAGFSLYVALEVREGRDEAVTNAERRIIRLGRSLDTRLDRFERRIAETPKAADVQRLEERLQQTETRAADAEREAGSAQDRGDDLERQLRALERDAGDRGSAGSER